MPKTASAPIRPIVAIGVDAVPPALTGGVVAIGNFDGLHLGHAALVEATVADARATGRPALLLSFEPHPRTFFNPAKPVFRLTSTDAKARLAGALGIDGLVVLPFDRTLADMTADDFMTGVLADRLKAKALVVGANFRFGKGRAGTADLLVEAGPRHGFGVHVVETVAAPDGVPVSSSAIRALLADGKVAEANRLLGYRWFVTGRVIPGDRRGRELGFPTANIRLPADCGLRHGIYAVTFRSGGATYGGVASFGRRPTFDNGPPLLEVFVFDFDGDLYGSDVIVTFVAWIRPEARFDTIDALVHAMNEDVAAARRRLLEPAELTALDRRLAAA